MRRSLREEAVGLGLSGFAFAFATWAGGCASSGVGTNASFEGGEPSERDGGGDEVPAGDGEAASRDASIPDAGAPDVSASIHDAAGDAATDDGGGFADGTATGDGDGSDDGGTGGGSEGGGAEGGGAEGGTSDGGASDGAGGFDAAGARDAAADSGAPPADGGSCVASPATDVCSALSALPAAPVIDGVLDCGPALVAMTPEGWNGASALAAGNSASVAAAWRPDGLYVFLQVVTPAVIPADPGTPPFDGTGAEIYADSIVPLSSTYANPGTIQLVAAAPSGSAPATIGEGYRDAVDQGAWSPAQFATYRTSTGFVLEAFVVAGDLGLSAWPLASGSQLGFDVAVNVSFTDSTTMSAQGHRAGQYFLHVAAPPIGAPYADPRAFCVTAAQ